jgi:hypothetical protein
MENAIKCRQLPFILFEEVHSKQKKKSMTPSKCKFPVSSIST